MKRTLTLSLVGLVCLTFAGIALTSINDGSWSPDELKTIQSLSLASLPALRPDPSNRVADDPAAAALGKALFFDNRLSANGMISCATCHKPQRQLQDDRAVAMGMAAGSRRTMPIAGSAYYPFLFWDGRKDSQWSQALGPLENPAEHGADRAFIVQLVTTAYRTQYRAIFGPTPDMADVPLHAMPNGANGLDGAWKELSSDKQHEVNATYANIGKALAAFERTIMPQATRFDAYAAALASGDRVTSERLFNIRERNGLRLFIGKANCSTCHDGPLFTDGAFHNIGLPGLDPVRDGGRLTSVAVLKVDPFNCLGPYSDTKPGDCAELNFIGEPSTKMSGAFRSSSLRGVSQRAPFMHAGQFATLKELLAHYQKAPVAEYGQSELKPLALTESELGDIEAFLTTLNANPNTNMRVIR